MAEVHRAILARLNEWGTRIGYSSAACGGDLLFLESRKELGGEPEIFLVDIALFKKSSVCITGDQANDEFWLERFVHLIESRHELKVFILSEIKCTDGLAFRLL